MERHNEDVQSPRHVIKLKCAVVVLMTLVFFALMALVIHLVTSHPHRNIINKLCLMSLIQILSLHHKFFKEK